MNPYQPPTTSEVKLSEPKSQRYGVLWIGIRILLYVPLILVSVWLASLVAWLLQSWIGNCPRKAVLLAFVLVPSFFAQAGRIALGSCRGSCYYAGLITKISSVKDIMREILDMGCAWRLVSTFTL